MLHSNPKRTIIYFFKREREREREREDFLSPFFKSYYSIPRKSRKMNTIVALKIGARAAFISVRIHRKK